MTELLEAMKLYKDFGWAGLCIIVVYFFYRELKASKAEVVEMTKLVTKTLDTAATAIEEMNDLTESTKRSVEDLCNQSRLFQAFLQGRDDNRGRDKER